MLHWAVWFVLFNILFLTAISFRLIGFMSPFEGAMARIYAPLALIGQFTLLSFLPFLFILIPLILVWPNRGLIWGLAAAGGGAGLILLWLDTVVYAQYRLHLSGFVFNLMLYGGSEIFSFSWMTWFLSTLVILGAFLLEAALIWLIWTRLVPLNKNRYAYLGLSLALAAFIGSHLIHAWAEAKYFQPITSMTRHIPLYYPLQATSFFKQHGWIDLEEERRQRDLKTAAEHKGAIRYPLKPLEYKSETSPLNLVLIVIDAWRFDALMPEITPNISKFTSDFPSWRFQNHFSGGNSTRAGIFTLFYGIPGTYWTGIESNQIGPVLIEELIRRDYQLGIFSSAKLTKPAFDRTVFTQIPDLQLKPRRGQPYHRDQFITDEWLTWIDSRKSGQPFFGFLYFDAARGSSFPPDYPALFEPVWERVDHLALNNDFDPEPYFNRYKRAVHYVDSLVGKVLEDLERRDLIGNTVIVITSDHGEEFNDNKRNFWGHGGNFTRYQTQVPLIIHWPGRSPADYDHRTSHFDLAPTLMSDLFGCINPYSDYSSGRHLLDRSDLPWMIITSYFNYAIVQEDRITVTFPAGIYEIVDLANAPVKGARLDKTATAEALREMTRFYR